GGQGAHKVLCGQALHDRSHGLTAYKITKLGILPPPPIRFIVHDTRPMVIARPPPRFFCDTPLDAGRLVALPDALAHHALRVLRLADGDAIILFDGRGGQYPPSRAAEGGRARPDRARTRPSETGRAGRRA